MFRLSRFALFVCAASAWAAPDASPSKAEAALARLPLRFEANQGQWNPAVRYAARGGDHRVFLTSHGPSLQFGGSRVDITLVNSNPVPKVEGLDRLPTRTDYLVGNRERWHTGIASYAKVRYQAVYPGVDLVYYGNQNQLEYDFVLQPGADPRAIRMKFAGARRVRITPEGDVAVETAGGTAVQKKASIYQDGRPVAGRYVMVARNVVALRLERYDRKRALVIDPVVVMATYMGGSKADQITAVALGPNGLLYITGSTETGDLLAINGAYDNYNDGETDIFIAIMDTTQTNYPVIYFSYLGGSLIDIPNAIAVDSSGDVYVTGTTTSTDFPMAGASVQTTPTASYLNIFVSEINPTLYGGVSLVYSTYLGGTTGDNIANGIAVDSNGMIYLIGTTRCTDFPVTASAYAGELWGPQDAFLAEIDPNNATLLYSTYLGGELSDDGRAIALGANGLVYFGISTSSTLFPMEGNSWRGNLQGNIDIILGVMDMTQSGTASLVYDTYFGGSANEEVRGIALDAAGNMLVTGYTLSPDFPVTLNALQSSYGGNTDAFVSVVNPNQAGFVIYSTYLGGSQGDVAYGIAGDSAGYIYVTGYTYSPDFPVTPNAPLPNYSSGCEIFLTKFKPGVAGTGALQYSTYYGASGVNVATTLAVDSNGTAYVGGYTTGDMYITPISYEGTYGGGTTDGFLLVVTK